MLLTIEKLIYGGEGLSHLPPDESGRGKAVFVPLVLPGERIEASITNHRPGFARAQLDRIVEPSSHRTVPGCPYFGRCGGCHYQHIEYEYQLEIKKEILRETLRRTGKLELPVEVQVHPSPPWNYRNRSRLQVQTSPTFQAGYFRMQSHELLVVEECPISAPLINRGIAALWKTGRAGQVPVGIREVEFFTNTDDSQMLIEISCTAESRRAAVRSWVEEFCSSVSGIVGCVAFREAGSKRQIGSERLLVHGADHLSYRAHNAAYRVSAGAFFQVNRYLTDELVKIVTTGQSGELALDLYAGVGLFSTALASDFHHIVSVETSQTSSADLAYNLTGNGEAVRATTEQYLDRGRGKGQAAKAPSRAFRKPELVVVDPPRNGLGERVARAVANLGAPRVVYVSCDPATLARDLVVLLGAGYRMEQVHLVDLFPQTYHMESVVHLVR